MTHCNTAPPSSQVETRASRWIAPTRARARNSLPPIWSRPRSPALRRVSCSRTAWNQSTAARRSRGVGCRAPSGGMSSASRRSSIWLQRRPSCIKAAIVVNPLRSICAAGPCWPWQLMQYVSRKGRTVRVNSPSNSARPSSWPRTTLRTAVAARIKKKPAQRVVNSIRSLRLRIARSGLDCRTAATWRQLIQPVAVGGLRGLTTPSAMFSLAVLLPLTRNCPRTRHSWTVSNRSSLAQVVSRSRTAPEIDRPTTPALPRDKGSYTFRFGDSDVLRIHA